MSNFMEAMDLEKAAMTLVVLILAAVFVIMTGVGIAMYTEREQRQCVTLRAVATIPVRWVGGSGLASGYCEIELVPGVWQKF